MVDEEVKKYVEAEILPKYVGVGGHTSKHVLEVIKRSLGFFEQAKELNINMVYVIAAYHDLGRIVDDERHNIESAKMLRADEFIKRHFSADEIEVMAEAIEDHRASLGREPRSIYGKLVSSADRNTDINEMLERSYDYAKYLRRLAAMQKQQKAKLPKPIPKPEKRKLGALLKANGAVR